MSSASWALPASRYASRYTRSPCSRTMSSHAGGVQTDGALGSGVVTSESVSPTNGAGPLALGRLDSETTSGSCSVERPSQADCSLGCCEPRVRQHPRVCQKPPARNANSGRLKYVTAGAGGTGETDG